MREGFRACAYIAFEGSQSQPLLPIFPTNTTIRGVVCSEVEFDGQGKLRSESLQLCFDAPLGVSPSVIRFLAQQAQLLASKDGGCRCLQRVVDVAEQEDRAALAHQFRGHVWDASASPHANFVLQKCVAVLPPREVLFIAEEFKGRAALAARHSIRRRVLERLVEHFPSEVLDELVRELVPEALRLCCNNFGNFVLQRVLEHGTGAQRSAVVKELSSDAVALARHSIASNVLRCAFINCPAGDQRVLAEALSADAAVFKRLGRHSTGSFVVREAKRILRAAGAQGGVQEISL